MTRRLLQFFLFLFVFTGPSLQAFEDPFEVFWDDKPRRIEAGETFSVSFQFVIPPDHYLYQEKTVAEPELLEAFEIIKVRPILGRPYHDPYLNHMTNIVEGGGEIAYWFQSKPDLKSGLYKIPFKVTYQGCSSKLCYRLIEKELVIPIIVGGVTALDSQEGGGWVSLLEKGDLWAYAAAFAGGILTDFTPCVLPLIPFLLLLIGVKKESSLKMNFLLSLVFVVGMAVTYSILGILVASVGLALGFLFQSPLFTAFLVLLYLVLALAMLGVFEIQMPLSLRNRLSKIGGAGFGGALLTGMVCGFLAAPCVGPVIGGLLVYVAQSQRLWFGASLLLSFALGMGVVFLLVGTFARQFAGKVRSSNLVVVTQRVLGLILFIPVFYYAFILYHQLIPDFSKSPNSANLQEGFFQTEESSAWETARQTGKGVIIDFSAKWCIPCLQLDKTFRHEKVQGVLKDFVLFKVDCTEFTPQCRELTDRYGVIGWPTLLFLSPDQRVLSGHTLVGKVPSVEELIQHLETVRQDLH